MPQDDLKGKLLNYDFNRVKMSISARSVLIDLIRKNDYDSLILVINYCDSVNYPDSSWLNKKERFLINYLLEDTTFLLNKNVYSTYLGLFDSPPWNDYYFCNPVFQFDQSASGRYLSQKINFLNENFSAFRSNLHIEDLGYILKLLADEKQKMNKRQYPQLTYLWDFLNIVFSSSREEHIIKMAEDYLQKYSESDFRELIAYNFIKKYKKSESGGAISATAYKHTFLPDESKLWLDNYPAIGFSFGYIRNNISYMFNMSFLKVETNSALVYGRDTLSDTIGINPINMEFSLGYVWDLWNSLYITPAISFDIFSPGPSPDAGKPVKFKIPTIYGTGLSLTIDKRLKVEDESFAGYVGSLRSGITYNDFSKIKDGLGNYRYFTEVSFGWKGWTRKRDYSF